MSLFSRFATPYRFHDDVSTAALGGGASWHAQSMLGSLFDRIDDFLDDLFDWIGHDPDDGGTTEPAAPTVGLSNDATMRLPLDGDGDMIRGVIGDPTDPALTDGIALDIADADTPSDDLTVTVESSDESIARAVLDNGDVLRIAPVNAGNATITVTVSDGESESRYTLDYAAADGTETNNAARFHTGTSDTSAAIAIGNGLVLVGDDEGQTLRLYDHDRSGAPLKSFDLNESLGLESGDEIDIESVVDAGNGTYFWLGSLASSERSTVFATRITGENSHSLQVDVTGQFDGLDLAIMEWAEQHRPDVDFGSFEVEGAAYADDTLFLGLRAPIDSDGRALVLPVTNVDELMAAGNADEAQFGTAIGLDLDGRTIRDIKAISDGTYLISAGPANAGDDDGDDSNDDFQLYRWDGAHKAVPVEGADLNTNAEATDGTAETLSNIQVDANGSVSVDVAYDNGTADWSESATESKDLDDDIQTFTSSTVTFDALPDLAPQAGDVALTMIDQAADTFSFVALAAITPGATLTLHSGDSRVTWTAPEDGLSAGSVIDAEANAAQFDGDLNLSLADGVTIANTDGDTLYRLGNGADADLSLPADAEAWQYAGITHGSTEALRDSLNDTDAWQPGNGDTADFVVDTGHAPLGDPEPQDLGIAISEIWPGQSGSDITEDWFEITNTGGETLDFGQTPLYYDDDSANPEEAAQVQGLTTLAPGATAIVMVDGDAQAVEAFRQAWGANGDLDGVEVGYTGDAAGLSGGGDQVTLWLGEPGRDTLAAMAAYPDTDANDAASWDVTQQSFTTLEDGGVESDALGGDDDATPAVATPGRVTGNTGGEVGQGGLLISEYVEGSGYNKAIELTNTGADALSLDGYQLSLYSNGNQSATSSADLGNLTANGELAAGETLVVASSQTEDPELIARSDATSNVINFNGNDALTLTDAEGSLIDVIGTVGNDASFAQDVTLRRDASITTGSDTFDASQWQQLPQDTFDGLGLPGAETGASEGGDDGSGDGGDTPTPPSETTLISQVQGAGMVSPLEGEQVTLDAIVTLASQDGLNGFFIQEEDADQDGDAQTSEGLFVYAPDATDVAVGDQIRISGTVTQYEGKTELTDISALQVEARGQALPSVTEVELPIADKSTLSAYEGMRVAVSGENDSALTVTDTYELGRYGTVTLSSGGRLEQYTENHAPNQAGYQQWLNESESRSIVLDDASNAQNPQDVIFGRNGEPLSAANPLRGGDTLDQATGVLDFNYQQWRIQSQEGQDFQATNERSDAPDVQALGDASLKVASFNVLNYFTTLDENGNSVVTPAGTEHDPRGANSSLELTRQQDKIVSAINGSDADIVGLMEIENNGYGDDSAIAHLVEALNADDADAGWAYVTPTDAEGNTVAPGSDAIAVGMIYKSTSVTPEGHAAVDASGVFETGNRPPMLQTFREDASGETFSVAVNHFKSKGSVLNGQEAIGDGQGNNNPIRVEAAKQLADWVASDPTDSGDSDTLLIGDFNSYANEDPITALEDDGYTLLDDDYSYSYDGQWGSLDHALASESMNAQVTGTTTWHINADEPTSFDYNTEYKSDDQVDAYYDDGPYRASDHDPIVVGVDLGNSADGTTLAG